MISLQRFEETFSLYTAQALDNYARYNLNKPNPTEYGLRIGSTVNDRSAMAELEITGLPVGELVCLNLNLNMDGTNQFRVQLGVSPNSIDFPWYEEGWKNGEGYRSILFKAPQETMYLDIGDYMAVAGLSVIVDNVELLINDVDAIADGDFDIGISDWYGATATTTLEHYEYNPPVTDNPYLEEVDIPEYTGAANQCRIPTDEPFTSSTFNNTQYDHFYIEPGDHSDSGDVIITASGDAINRKTISLYNGNDIHAGKLADNERAFYSVYLDSASYWTVDRPSYKGAPQSPWEMWEGSTHNIFNRSYSRETGQVFLICHLSHYNTIQNCRFEVMPENYRDVDTMCVLIQHNRSGSPANDVWIYGTKLINNEAVDQNDWLHVARNSYSGDPQVKQRGNMKGLVVDGNKLYSTAAPAIENAIDIKIGSDDPGDPILVTNNIMWGYKASQGDTALVFNGNVHNAYCANNVIFDSWRSLTCSSLVDVQDEQPLGLIDSIVENNIIHGCGHGGDNEDFYPISENTSDNSVYRNNLITESSAGKGFFSGGDNWNGCLFENNDICATENQWWAKVSNSSEFTDSVNNDNNHYNTAADAGYTEDLVIDYDMFTSNPKQITLANVLKP